MLEADYQNMHKEWTNARLKSFNPCPSGYEWYEKNCLEKEITDTATILRMLMEADEWQYARWTAARALGREGRLKWAIFSAEQVLDIYEKRYPKRLAPRKAIEAARAVLANDTQENRELARQACAADAAAAYADAAYAAYAAAAAAYAADAAYAAAAADAYAAYAADAYAAACFATGLAAGTAAADWLSQQPRPPCP